MMAGPELSEGYTGRVQYSTAGYDCEVLVLVAIDSFFYCQCGGGKGPIFLVEKEG